MATAEAITTELAAVGEATLTELAAATGISKRTGIFKSTLSRLESGHRKPSLELLLPIAQADKMSPGELVAAPEVSDPRIRLKPRARSGRIVAPLTRHLHGRHAWKASSTNLGSARTRATNGSMYCPATCG